MGSVNTQHIFILRYSITCLGSGLFLVGLCPPPVLPPPLGPRFLNIQIRLHSSSLQNLSVPPHSPREKSPTSLEEDAFISHTLSFPFLPTLLPSLSLGRDSRRLQGGEPCVHGRLKIRVRVRVRLVIVPTVQKGTLRPFRV